MKRGECRKAGTVYVRKLVSSIKGKRKAFYNGTLTKADTGWRKSLSRQMWKIKLGREKNYYA